MLLPRITTSVQPVSASPTTLASSYIQTYLTVSLPPLLPLLLLLGSLLLTLSAARLRSLDRQLASFRIFIISLH